LDPHFEVPEDLMHLAFPVDDMPTLFREWEANGVVITEGKADDGMIFAADPDGYELEMIQRRR
jgi:catechol 2,3-dioxygenase-like lactoylglutathione lyase family enzyme